MKKNIKAIIFTISIIIGVILVVLATVMFFKNLVTYEQDNLVEITSAPEDICSRIQVSPSWANENGEIIKVGYVDFGNMSLIVVEEYLIPAKIYFLHHLGCGWCRKQINEFGLTWEFYEESGYAIDCSKVK